MTRASSNRVRVGLVYALMVWTYGLIAFWGVENIASWIRWAEGR